MLIMCFKLFELFPCSHSHSGDSPALYVCAVISGLVAVSICNPADVVKSRVMMARGGGAQLPISGVILQVWSLEGPAGFMRGWFPAYSRAGPAYFIQMPIVEYLRTAFGLDTI